MKSNSIHKARGLVGDGKFWTLCGKKSMASNVAYVWSEVSCKKCRQAVKVRFDDVANGRDGE